MFCQLKNPIPGFISIFHKDLYLVNDLTSRIAIKQVIDFADYHKPYNSYSLQQFNAVSAYLAIPKYKAGVSYRRIYTNHYIETYWGLRFGGPPRLDLRLFNSSACQKHQRTLVSLSILAFSLYFLSLSFFVSQCLFPFLFRSLVSIPFHPTSPNPLPRTISFGSLSLSIMFDPLVWYNRGRGRKLDPPSARND